LANPTTNYGFVLPTPTDLVTDLPADFDVALQGVDTQMLTNANAAIAKTIVDVKGDLIAATATDAVSRLAVGANATVLTADSAEATGMKWAAAAAGSGMVHLKTATFSGVADTGTTFDSLFTSAYNSYTVIFNNLTSTTGTGDLEVQLRYAGPTTQILTYVYAFTQLTAAAGTSVSAGSATTRFVLANELGNTPGYGTNGRMYLNNLLSAGSRPTMNFSLFNEYENANTGGGYQYTSRVYTGLLLKATAGNISGTVSVYGLVNA
jgi:hypothetical protein